MVLKDFAQVNYFVGENGSGKTSIIHAISHLNERSNQRVFFRSDSIVEFSIGNMKQNIIWDDNDPNKTSHTGDLAPNIFAIVHHTNGLGANGIVPYETGKEIHIDNKNTLDEVNEFLSILGHSTLKAEKIINQEDAFDKDAGKLVFKENNSEINLHFLSDGVKFLYNLRKNILTDIRNRITSPGQNNRNNAVFILIEEPEVNLHPKWQKQIPELLNKFISEIAEPLKSKIFFFVSTHSPFIIGAAANYNDQKVYLMDDGALLNLKHERVSRSEGYTGDKCADVVGGMLGADVTDLGYPENYCILEENSMLYILNKAKEKGIIRNITFVSASGVDNTQNLANAIASLDTLIKCNPFYSDKYHLIIDKPKTPYGKSSKIGKIKDRLGDRYIQLEKESLEDYYPNIDDDLYAKVKSDITDKPKEKGIVKGEYANKISEKINSAEDFSKLFGNELDFLLK